jgi:DNA replication protein DnaC
MDELLSCNEEADNDDEDTILRFPACVCSGWCCCCCDTKEGVAGIKASVDASRAATTIARDVDLVGVMLIDLDLFAVQMLYWIKNILNEKVVLNQESRRRTVMQRRLDR